MRIYLSHPTRGYEYRKYLYEPIQASPLVQQHEFIYPHEREYNPPRNTKEEINRASLVIAEVSFPSTGQGIELGWADEYKTPILCIYQYGREYSRSLLVVTKNINHYSSTGDMIEKIGRFIEEHPSIR